MVKYYGRSRQRTGSVNTNQLGLKMSGCPSRVGRNPVNSNYISRRVNCMQGICGTPIVNGKIWTKNFGLKNQLPYCKNPSNKCLAAAGGIGNIKTPYYRTPAPGEKGCGLTQFEQLEQRDGCGEGFEFIAAHYPPQQPLGSFPQPPPGLPLSLTGAVPFPSIGGDPNPIGVVINNSITQNIIGFLNVLWGDGTATGTSPGPQTLICARSNIGNKSIKICSNGSIIKELTLGDKLVLNGEDVFAPPPPYANYRFYVVKDVGSELGTATPNAITITPGTRYTIIE